MSAGNPIIKVRISKTKLSQIQEAILSANSTRKEKEYDLSEWVRTAINDKLNHLIRSKRRKKNERMGIHTPPGNQATSL